MARNYCGILLNQTDASEGREDGKAIAKILKKYQDGQDLKEISLVSQFYF